MKNKTRNARLRGMFLSFLCVSLLVCPINAQAKSEQASSENIEISSRILDLFFGKHEADKKTLYLCPSGQAFGMKIRQNGVTVTAIHDPESPVSRQLAVGDIILSINGKPVEGVQDLCERISAQSAPFSITVLRGKEKKALLIYPEKTDEGFRLGIEVKDTAAGIGTVTYIDPETGAFGGLGHGICAPDTGELYPMKSGTATEVILGGVLKGASGKPGELRGVLSHTEIGSLEKNSACGVFGTLSLEKCTLPSPLPVGTRDEVTAGPAEILSSIKNGAPARYAIRITEIDRSATDSKSFRIEVTDPALIALTGGIVRGMSGSPIIQNGKLVGAVTHVLVANPTEGYGIFIENMLNTAESQVMPKAA